MDRHFSLIWSLLIFFGHRLIRLELTHVLSSLPSARTLFTLMARDAPSDLSPLRHTAHDPSLQPTPPSDPPPQSLLCRCVCEVEGAWFDDDNMVDCAVREVEVYFYSPGQALKAQFASEGNPLLRCLCFMGGEGSAYVRRCNIYQSESKMVNGYCQFCRAPGSKNCSKKRLRSCDVAPKRASKSARDSSGPSSSSDPSHLSSTSATRSDEWF